MLTVLIICLFDCFYNFSHGQVYEIGQSCPGFRGQICWPKSSYCQGNVAIQCRKGEFSSPSRLVLGTSVAGVICFNRATCANFSPVAVML